MMTDRWHLIRLDEARRVVGAGSYACMAEECRKANVAGVRDVPAIRYAIEQVR